MRGWKTERSTARFVNGVLAALITVLFIAHGTLGSISVATGFHSALTWLVWVAVALVVAHVIASIITSYGQLSDKERPPSARKKRHLALKWVTGGLLAAAAIAHIALPKSMPAEALVIVVVSVALAVHLWVGSKSLLKDVGIDRRYMTAFRVVACAFAVLFVVVMVAVMAMTVGSA